MGSEGWGEVMNEVCMMGLSEITDTQPQREHGDLSSLKASILRHGLLEPLVVEPNGSLIAGRRRYQALSELVKDHPEFATIPVRIRQPANKYERFLMSWDENRERKAETWQEEALNAKTEKRIYEETFPETRHGGDRRSENQVCKLHTCSDTKPPSYTESKAAVTGVSRTTVQRQVQLAEAMEEHPEIAEAKTASEARRMLSRIKKQQNMQPLPDDKYRIIYADPPWQYGNSGLDDYGHAERHYPTMSIAELCNMPVSSMAAKDSVLFLWVTSPLLEEAFKVINSWGFKYKTSFVWDKVKHNFGHYNSVRHELLLVCTRGSCTPDTPKLYDSVQSIERSEKHSEKPEEFRAIIDELYTHGRRIELFAREKTEGWEVWGNEC
jgi:N6-adenosine-specific RNA methylase IME4